MSSYEALLRDKHELWRRGELRWKLKPVQLKIYQAFWSSTSLKYVVNCARRLGKSYALCVIALEFALKHPGAQIRFAAPTQKALKKIIRPLFKKICKDAPADCRPTYNSQDGVYTFPNGSEIHIAGANAGHAESLRGTEADLCLVDEAGFIDDLEYLIQDILLPQMMTTNGRLILSSTPPRTPAHDFKTFVEAAEKEGAYSTFDIYQAGYDPAVIARWCRESGGENSSTWQREYLCLFVVDKDSAIVPEWDDKFLANYPTQRPQFWTYFHKYEGMDIGVEHKTVVIFGYYDFLKARLVIDGEFVINGPHMTTEKLAEGIKRWETEAFGFQNAEGEKELAEIYQRIADDNNPLLLQDLSSDYDIAFAPIMKDNLDAMVNQFRVWVAAGRLTLNPKCTELLGCLKYGVWQERGGKGEKKRAVKAQRQFAVSKTYGHFDALAAAIYLVRGLDLSTNPFPKNLNISLNTHFVPQEDTEPNRDGDTWKQITPGMRSSDE